jgi:hypothetical protein
LRDGGFGLIPRPRGNVSVAHIIILTHVYDFYQKREYFLRSLSPHWLDAGHRVSVVSGTDHWPAGDLAILHIDLSVIPTAYAEASQRYAVVVNGAARDIRKRCVSRYLLNPGDAWEGPVIVKTNLNCGGLPERLHCRIAQHLGKQSDVPSKEIVSMKEPYPILRSLAEVPKAVWNNPGLVVERFLPEQDVRGYWTRAWVFFGDRERCTRYLGNHPIVKSGNILAREPASIPEELRAERRRLGFDYGKFDFVVRDGQAILLDANRTPWTPHSLWTPEMEASNYNLALGLDSLLRT